MDKETHGEETTLYVSYRSRYLAVFVVFFLNVCNSNLWLTFSPIATSSSEYFGVSLFMINALTSVFYVYYPVVSLPQSFVIDRYGIRFGLWTGALLTLFAAILNYVAAITNIFGVLILGQSLAAIAQPLFLNAPSKMASTWFRAESRSSAAIVATLGNPIGGAVAGILSSVLVSKPDDIPFLMLVNSAICFAAVIPLIFLKAKPPTPPSATADSGLSHFDSFMSQIKFALANRNYIILIVVFGIVVSIFNSFATLLNQILMPFGYSEDTSGLITAGMIIGGIVGAGIGGFLSDKFRRQQLLFVKIILPIVLGFTIVLLIMLSRDRLVLLTIVIFFIGFFCFMLMPFGLAILVELTWPVDESVSTGIAWMAGNALSVVLVYCWSVWNWFPSDPDQSLRGGLIITSGLLLFTSIFIQFAKMTFNRLEMDKEETEALLD